MAATRLASAHDPVPAQSHHIKPLVLLPLADGSDELEALTIYDALTRGGADVVTASVGEKKKSIVVAAHGMKLRALKPLEDCIYDRFDLIVLPGGVGAAKLRDCDLLIRMLKLQKQKHRYIAAIGDAPTAVLATFDLLDGPATCHQTKVRFMGERFINEPVVVTGHCVTSQGAATALEFAMTLVQLVCSAEEATKAAKQLLYPLTMP